MATKTKLTRQCLKAVELRKTGYENLDEWMEMKGNVACVRPGRIFIKARVPYQENDVLPKGSFLRETKDGRKTRYNYFGYAGNKVLCNPGLDLDAYEKYALNNLDFIRAELCRLNATTIGCFCKTADICHTGVLLKLLNE